MPFPQVYTQHVPLLINTLDAAMKGKLRESNYPAVGPIPAGTPASIVVFVVGGVTYEESTKVAELNASGSGMKVVLGSTQIHNRSVFSFCSRYLFLFFSFFFSSNFFSSLNIQQYLPRRIKLHVRVNINIWVCRSVMG
jgi:hypothetical protein